MNGMKQVIKALRAKAQTYLDAADTLTLLNDVKLSKFSKPRRKRRQSPLKGRKRHLSAQAIRAIKAAQKVRWDKWRAAQKVIRMRKKAA